MSTANVSVNIEDIAPLTKKMKFNIPWTSISSEMQKEYKKVVQVARIDGFRKGKVPRSIIEQRFRPQVEEETINNLINKYYWDEIEKLNLAPVTPPQITQNGIKDNDEFVFWATIEVEPTIEPTGYDGLVLEEESATVTQDDIDARLKEVREMYSTLEESAADAKLAMGSFANISFQGTCDGVEREDMKSDDYMLEIGSKAFIPGFEEQLIGMASGETKDIPIKFPSDYHKEELRDKDVSFNVTLKGIREKVMPEINEEFLKNLQAFNSMDAFMDNIKESLVMEKNKDVESALRSSIIEKLLAANQFDAPPSYVERQLSMMLMDLNNRLIAQGLDKDTATKASLSQRETYRESAESIVKTMLLMRSIAEKESVFVSDEEVDAHIKEIAEKNKIDFNRIKEMIKKNEGQEKIRFEIFDDKIFAIIKGKSTITTKQAEAGDA